MSVRSSITALAAAAALVVGASSTAAGTLGTFTSGPEGFDTHTYFYDDGKEVTVIDTQFVPQLTRAMVEHIRQRTSSPITRVIVTHPNPDKFNGLSVLHELGAQSLASEATAKAMPAVHEYKKYFFVNVAKAFTEESYPKFEPVRSTFRGQTTVKLKSGETLTLVELRNPGVASNQTVVRIDKTGDLLVGDLVHYQTHAWLEGGITNGGPRPDLTKWRAAVRELETLGQGVVYGGRGKAGRVKDVVAYQTDYLAKAEGIVGAYVDATPKAELQDVAKAQQHYQKLQKLFEQQFPATGLSYLIGYGIYGLVNSKLN
jgi:glyoxylase-like metal-dependent hydrolase (beta-lactamase superfamily II)